MSTTDPVTVYDFRKGTPVTAWAVQDDVVMGGRSQGRLSMTEAGHACFTGHVSLENDGGFSSILHTLKPPVAVDDLGKFVARIKGDGKEYSLRVKTDPANDFYYEASFPTNGDWELVEVTFADMKAVHHGEPVDVPNFAGGTLTKVQVLIGNKVEEDFELLIDRIEAR